MEYRFHLVLVESLESQLVDRRLLRIGRHHISRSLLSAIATATSGVGPRYSFKVATINTALALLLLDFEAEFAKLGLEMHFFLFQKNRLFNIEDLLL